MQICEFFIYLKSTFLVCLSCCAALIKQSQIKLIYCQWLNFTALQRRLNFRKLICFSDIFSYTFKIVKKTNKQTKGKEKKTVNPLMLIMLLPLFLSLSHFSTKVRHCKVKEERKIKLAPGLKITEQFTWFSTKFSARYVTVCVGNFFPLTLSKKKIRRGKKITRWMCWKKIKSFTWSCSQDSFIFRTVCNGRNLIVTEKLASRTSCSY